MSGEFSLQTDDLVVFFSDAGGQVVNRWLPKTVYTDERLKIEPSVMDKIAPGWQGAIVTETNVDGGAWFLANLNQLKTQDSGNHERPKEIVNGPAMSAINNIDTTRPNHEPQRDDLVVVSFSPGDNGAAFLITREIYKSCPRLPDALAADLEFLAVEDGVVFANVPKPEPFGISCALLGLNNLRSAALPLGASPEADKTTVARLARRQP